MPYSFEKDFDEGIFAESPHAGDRNAKEDMDLEHVFVAPINMHSGVDNLPIPDINDVDIFGELPAVDYKSFKCNIGPCKHYTECLVLVPSGPDHDAEDLHECKRWCGRIRTWAEQTDITEVEIYSCTGYEPVQSAAFSDEVSKALAHNIEEAVSVRRHALLAGFDYGICVNGPCENYFEVICRKPNEEEKESVRYCMRLAGLGRLFSLNQSHIDACNSWKPLAFSCKMSDVNERNIKLLEDLRRAMSLRKASGNDAE